MWCATCQQDVSSPAAAGAETARCGKCGQELAKDEQAHCPAAKTPTRPCLAEDWELEADLRGVERYVAGRLSEPTAQPSEERGAWPGLALQGPRRVCG